MTHSGKVPIDADTDRIWRCLSTPEIMSQWMDGIDGLRTEDGAALRKGSVLRFVARGKERTSSVEELTPGKALMLRSVQGPIAAEYRYLIESDQEACQVSMEVSCRGSGLARAFAPLICLVAWHTDKGQIDRLKAIAEQSDDRPGDMA